MGGDSLLWASSVHDKDKVLATLRQGILNRQSRIVCLSSVIVAFLEELGLANTIVAVDQTAFISSPALLRRIQEGLVASVKPGTSLDVERILSMQPDAVFYYEGAGGEDPSFSLLKRNGIKLIPVNNYKEQHPLGRAEWIRFVGRIFGIASQADSLFDAVARSYEDQKNMADQQPLRPTVFCNAPFSGVWDQPQGGNYMAVLINDAGGRYLWAETTGSGTISLQPEAVLLKAQNADIWINCNDYTERRQLLSEDPRLSRFKAFSQGRVFAANAVKREGGANPFWELGVVRPDLVLHDLRQIFSAAGDTLSMYFYRKLR